MCRKTIGLLAVAFLISVPTMAAEGRIPVFAPTVIVADGKYIVTRPIAGAGLAPVIDIAFPSANVDLDLNGFTLSQPAAGPAVILISAPVKEVRIHNGTLAGGANGIEAPGAGRKVIVEDVKVQDCGGPAPGAIHTFDVENVVIRRSVIQDAPSMPGIAADGPGVIKTGTIEDNVIRRTAGGIVVTSASAMAILHNRIEEGTPVGGPGIGFDGGGSLISENTIQSAVGDGIQIRQGKGNKLFDNVVHRSTANGIFLSPGAFDTLVLNNVSTANGIDGLHVDGAQNHIDRNVLNSNTDCGLVLTGGAFLNTFGRNTARANAGAGACGGAACVFFVGFFPPDGCDAGGGNTSFGDNLAPGPPLF